MILGKDGIVLSGLWERDPGETASRSCAACMCYCVLCQKTKEIPPWIVLQTVFDQTRPFRRWQDAGRSSSSSNLWEALPSLLTNVSSDPVWPPKPGGMQKLRLILLCNQICALPQFGGRKCHILSDEDWRSHTGKTQPCRHCTSTATGTEQRHADHEINRGQLEFITRKQAPQTQKLHTNVCV